MLAVRDVVSLVAPKDSKVGIDSGESTQWSLGWCLSGVEFTYEKKMPISGLNEGIRDR